MVSYRNNEPGAEPEPVKETKLYVSDHREVNGLLLPHHLRTTVDNEVTEELDVSTFVLNGLRSADFGR
jgi:hypothetical protein